MSLSEQRRQQLENQLEAAVKLEDELNERLLASANDPVNRNKHQLELRQVRGQIDQLEAELNRPGSLPTSPAQAVTNQPLRVFLCHSSGDKAVVRQLYQQLLADGFDPWLDEVKLLPGQEWREEIEKAVESCEVVVVCLTPESITKEGYVNREIRVALDAADYKPEGTIFIIPLKLKECDVPRRLRRWQYVNYFERQGYERLRQALNVRAASLGMREVANTAAPPTPTSPAPPPVSNPGLPAAFQIVELLPRLAQAEASQDWDSAIEIGEYILTLNKTHRQAIGKTAAAYKERAIIYHSEGGYEQAIAELTRAIELVPNKAQYYYERCRSYQALNRLAEYRADLERAAELGHLEAKIELVMIEAEEAKAREAKAREAKAREAEEDPTRFVAALNSDDPTTRQQAAETALAIRLQNLRGLDPTYITYAEYQLFLDEKRQKGAYFQPDHWADFRFPKGQATIPITGVRAWDAQAFCDWLNARTGGSTRYRLPYPGEVTSYPVIDPLMAAWCRDEEGYYTLKGLSPQSEQQLRQQIGRLSKTNLPPPSDRALDLALDLDLAFALALALALDRDLARDLDLAFDRALALDRDLDLARNLDLARDRDRDLALALALDRALALDLDRARKGAGKEEFEKIVKALEGYDWDEAERLTRILQTASDVFIVRRATLLIDLITVAKAAKANRFFEWRRAYRQYAAHLAEYAYIGYKEWNTQKYAEEMQIMVDLYWWAQIVMAREEGKLPAWEGIRIVAEG